MDKVLAKDFVVDWLDAWNAHDIDRVLSHYTENFEMSSPLIAQLLGERSGVLRGKHAVGNYWRKALQLVPNLRFELISVLLGVNSITIYYKGAKGQISAEVFEFDPSGLVTKASAHYAMTDCAT